MTTICYELLFDRISLDPNFYIVPNRVHRCSGPQGHHVKHICTIQYQYIFFSSFLREPFLQKNSVIEWTGPLKILKNIIKYLLMYLKELGNASVFHRSQAHFLVQRNCSPRPHFSLLSPVLPRKTKLASPLDF